MFPGLERTNLFSTYTVLEQEPLEKLTCHYWLQKYLRANALSTGYETVSDYLVSVQGDTIFTDER